MPMKNQAKKILKKGAKKVAKLKLALMGDDCEPFPTCSSADCVEDCGAWIPQGTATFRSKPATADGADFIASVPTYGPATAINFVILDPAAGETPVDVEIHFSTKLSDLDLLQILRLYNYWYLEPLALGVAADYDYCGMFEHSIEFGGIPIARCRDDFDEFRCPMDLGQTLQEGDHLVFGTIKGFPDGTTLSGKIVLAGK